ncbi:hypothetical protein [Streptomyces sp. 4F14]|uniref:hypothetical protein n=1 Tax=Streptomyces sp. 4F14 TaxID=3394380 RepID=UPI003A89C4CC
MTGDRMAERPVEDLDPEWIGLRLEAEDEQGVKVGFRLGRYEKSTVDGKPVWRLFSDHPAWSVTVYAGATLRCVPPEPPPERQARHDPQQPVPAVHPAPQYPASAPSGPAVRSPQSWVTQPPHPHP